MPRRFSITLGTCVALVAAFASAQPAPEPVAAAAVTVEVVGHAATYPPTDPADARRAALEDALRRAVEAGAGVHVASESVTDHAQLTRDAVTVTSAGRVHSYRVLDEGPDGAGRYAVRLSADVVPDGYGPTSAPHAGGGDDPTAVRRVLVVAQGQPQTAACAAQRLRDRGMNAHASDGGDALHAHGPALVIHTTQRCVPAPDAYGQPLVRADVSVTATLIRADPDAPRSGSAATRHAFGSTAAAAAVRAHQRALDAALENALNAADPELFAPARNP